ncbi:MAG: hypothetical protein KC519_05655, partial [Anaerolineae bacterium]|nr:hypothetical protein [Anaerolineae bacterium]
LTEVGPSVVEGYRGYGYVPAINLIFGDFQSLLTLGLSALLMLLGLRQRAALGRLFFVIAILGLATVLSFVLQTKGWRYHALPMLNLIFLMGGLLLVQAFMRPRLRILLRRRRLDTVFLAATIIVCVLIGVMLAPEFIYGEARDAEQMPFLHYSQPGDAVIVADIEVVTVYPAVIQTGRIPVGRYPMAYPLAFAYANLSALPDDVYAASHTPPPLAQTYLDVLMDDIEQKQPPLILLRANTRSDVATYVNLAEYIKAHTDIEPLLARQYDYQGIASGYEVYVRKAGL